MSGRYYEVDALRGTALLLMVLYHIAYCLYFFRIYPLFDPHAFTGAPVAAIFIAVAGVSLILANRTPAGTLKRGAKLLVFAFIITVVTWIVYPQNCVIFGILHLIGCGTILAIPFLSGSVQWYICAAVGAGIILLSVFLPDTGGSLLLLPLGIPYTGFTSLDYEPLIPWFGVLLAGVAAGKLLYPEGKRGVLLSRIPKMPKALSPLCFIGRRSLLIYMLHVPVIILCLFLLFPEAVLPTLF